MKILHLFILAHIRTILVNIASHSTNGKYIGIDPSRNYPIFTDYENAEILSLKPAAVDSRDVYIASYKTPGEVFDLKGNGKELIMYKHNGQYNQRFYLVKHPSNGYQIINQGLCIQYMNSTKDFKKKTCDGNPDQLFDFVRVEDNDEEEKNSYSESSYNRK
ncbi:hypothetical protein TCON_0119 [Astathelohania contejeani]|uniref:Ricin B lectin domain-containing protein n=1 Tax=Astathelohania contejeani TaxID=164912 RepID=A0ABQ7I2L5_9MICR|nr:hypothetical protein TCON_0119 [Thelohania contejeani]